MLALILAGYSTTVSSGVTPAQYLLGQVLVGGLVGGFIGFFKNRTILGVVLGVLLGCIGWIIIAVLDKKRAY